MSAAPVAAAAPLGPLERAIGMPFGPDRDVAVLPVDRSRTPRQALEAVLLAALVRSPCVVSFSGGRDSSTLLAVATHVARREGLPLPVPATLVFPDDVASHETEWQDAVLDHLGLTERIVITDTGDRFDAVGPDARDLLGRLGLIWPFNLHFHLPIVAAAAGGAVVTGFGGDEIALSTQGARAERLLARRAVTRPRDVATIGLRLAPPPVRYLPEVWRAREQMAVTPWLTPLGRALSQAAYATGAATVPLGWGRLLRRWIWRSRYFRVTVHNTAAMAAPYGVAVVHPFVEPGVLSALAGHAPFAGVGGRSDLLRLLAGDLLPAEVLRRTSKATFGATLWTPTSQEFARSWDGAGVDGRLVDHRRLRAAWSGPKVNAFAATLMQQAWLGSHPSPAPAVPREPVAVAG